MKLDAEHLLARTCPGPAWVEGHTFEAVQLQALRDAIWEFDVWTREHDGDMRKAKTCGDVLAVVAADRRALELVQDAFHGLTSTYNNLDHCRLAGIKFMRRCAARFVPE
jgi:hypothetical protein